MAGKTKFGALNIKVTILEQPHLAQNKFLMTVADIFANSQTDLKQLATQTATQALGLQSKDAIQQKLEDKNKLLNEADTALATAKDAEKALQNASEAERNQKETALRVAKRNANVAFAKAGFSLGDLPYQDSYPVVGGP
jgi:Zn-dependent M16 (insulinase) family peptidase